MKTVLYQSCPLLIQTAAVQKSGTHPPDSWDLTDEFQPYIIIMIQNRGVEANARSRGAALENQRRVKRANPP